jgi:putative thioredoxin
MSATTYDVTTAGFEKDVIEKSDEAVVVIDFWAPWCGPCKTLGPILEDEIRKLDGRAVLAKVNVDENPELAQAFQAQSIPMVVAIHKRRPVSSFLGAQPRDVVQQWLKQVVPSAAETSLESAKKLLAEHEYAQAETVLRKVLAANPNDQTALLELARVLARRGERAEALVLLDRVPAGTAEYDAAERERLMFAMFDAGERAGDLAAAKAKVAANPADSAARFALAGAHWLEGEIEPALSELLTIVRKDRAFWDDGARKTLLALFDYLGEGIPAVDTARSELANILFS